MKKFGSHPVYGSCAITMLSVAMGRSILPYSRQ